MPRDNRGPEQAVNMQAYLDHCCLQRAKGPFSCIAHHVAITLQMSKFQESVIKAKSSD